MNIFKTYFKRNSIICSIFLVFLSLAVAFGSLGFLTWYGTEKQLMEIDNQYTTIAVPNNDYLWEYFHEEPSVGEVNLRNTTGVQTIDRRGVLGAYIENSKRLTAYETGNVANKAANWYNTQLVVLAVRCDSVSPYDNIGVNTLDDGNGNIIVEELTIAAYEASFSVLDTIARSDSYDQYPIETVTLGGLFTNEFEIPFEPGNTYLLFGIAYGYGIMPNETGEKYIVDESLAGWQTLMWDHSNGAFFDEGLLVPGEIVESNGKFYSCLANDEIPVYAKYEGSWEDYIASEDGNVWRETIIPMCKVNYASATLILSDNIYSMIGFNDGTASILEGRGFTDDEYENGTDVCLVSAAYAEKNGLSVGDTLSAELYTCDVASAMTTTQSGFSLEHETLYLYEPLKETNKLDMQKVYTIVGIYSSPEFPASRYHFDANTIFVPKASVPDSQNFERPVNNLLNSIILNNGTQQAFLDAVEEEGYEGYFEVYDMEYSSVAGALISSQENAERLFLVGTIVFILVSILYFVFLLQRMKSTITSVRLIGMNAKQVQNQLLIVLLTNVIISIAVGTAFSMATFNRLSILLLSENMNADPIASLLCAVVQLVFMLLLGFVFVSKNVNRNMMRKK